VFHYVFLCCLCVNVYCTIATGCQPNCIYQVYHISYQTNEKLRILLKTLVFSFFMFCDVAQNILFVCLEVCRLGPSCHSELSVALKIKINTEHLWNVKTFSRCRPGVAQRVGRGIALPFMTAALEGGEWSAARSGRNLPPGKTRYPFYLWNDTHGKKPTYSYRARTWHLR